MKIYVASSWRNPQQPEVVQHLRQAGHEVYDFKDPAAAFHWSEIDPNWESWSAAEFQEALEHPKAQIGFSVDMAGMAWADACVLVMPCGRSAHIEAGWFVGAGKPCIILLSDGAPEVMYKMATTCTSLSELDVEIATVGRLPGSRTAATNLAIKVVNLRHVLELTNKALRESGQFALACDEDAGPLFAESRAFYNAVKKVESEA